MRLVVFDLDGTLTRTTRVDAACFVRACRDEFGLLTINTEWSRYRHTTDSGIAAEILEAAFGRAPTAAELTALQQRFVGYLRDTFASDPGVCTPIAGAAAAIEALRSSGWALAIATGSWRASAELKMRHAAIPSANVPAAFADDGPARERIVQTAIARVREAHVTDGFERIVSVGDAVWDVRTARRLRLPFVGIGDGRRAQALRDEGASCVLPDFRDLARLRAALGEAQPPAAPACT